LRVGNVYEAKLGRSRAPLWATRRPMLCRGAIVMR